MTERAGRRRQARERALGFLYEAETKELHPASVIGGLPVPPDPYAARLALAAGDHRDQVDHLLTGITAPKWRIERMPAMDRAVLRLAVAELAFSPEVPEGVVLSEAADLAGRYGTDESPRFVNGVLARAATMLREEDAWPAPEVLLLDCDGLFRRWSAEPIHEAEERLGVERGAIFRAAFEPELFHRATVGEITEEEWAAEIARRVDQGNGGDLQAIAAAWLVANWEVDLGFVAVVERVRAAGRARVGLFSNATTNLEADLEAMGIDHLFDVVVNSARIGLAKPDPAAFERATAMVATDAARVVFVDDRTDNVLGALDAGLQAFRHTADTDRFEAALVRLGLLDAPGPPS